MLKYLSPTSIQAWRQDQEEFYLKYIAVDRPPRFPQTVPMAVGSAFDAYVKSYLYSRLVGDGNPKYEMAALFEKQVEPANRDKALVDGKHVFERYQELGCLADLMVLLENGNPRFEFTIEGEDTAFSGVFDAASKGLDAKSQAACVLASEAISQETSVSDISVSDSVINNMQGGLNDGNTHFTLLGKPDAYFTDRFGNDIILDWKVNGYYGTRVTSPTKGYVKLRPGGACHRGSQIMEHRGVNINVTCNLDAANEAWALQTTIYSWLCGAQVGSDFIVAIDQIVGPATGLRVAEHRSLVSPSYQWRLWDEVVSIWEITHSDWVFRGLGKDESQERCDILDKQAQGLRDAGSWFASATRGSGNKW